MFFKKKKPEKPFECILCKQGFDDKHSAKRHVIENHKKDINTGRNYKVQDGRIISPKKVSDYIVRT